MHLIRFLHVLLSVTLVGGFIANYFYINLTIKENNKKLLTFILRRSIFVDCIFFLPTIFLMLATGSYQVIMLNIPIKTPWIISAYLFFGLITFCWFILFFLKSYNYVFIDQQQNKLFKGTKIFHVTNLLIIFFSIAIIHDAVRKMTFIPWEILK